MSDAAEILQSVQIGLNVFIFLLNTDRGPQATELCVECAVFESLTEIVTLISLM